MAAQLLKQIEQATAVTLLGTELNSLGNNALVLSATAVLVNTIGTANTDGYVRGKMELKLAAVAGAMIAGSAILVWFLGTVDNGTSYEDGDASTEPAREADVVFPVRAVSTAQRIHRRPRVPVGTQYILVKNAGTGQALAATLNTLKLLLSTVELV